MSIFFSGSRFLLAAAAAAALVACGGGGGSSAPLKVAAADTTVAISPATGAAATAAISGQTLTFDTGVAGLGTTASTTVKVTSGVGTAPATFAVASGSGTATGDFTFGSCIFTPKFSNIPSMPVGTPIVINPCSLGIKTAGLTANGVSQPRGVAAIFGGSTSSVIQLPAVLGTDGALSFGGILIGTVSTTNLTGS